MITTITEPRKLTDFKKINYRREDIDSSEQPGFWRFFAEAKLELADFKRLEDDSCLNEVAIEIAYMALDAKNYFQNGFGKRSRKLQDDHVQQIQADFKRTIRTFDLDFCVLARAGDIYAGKLSAMARPYLKPKKPEKPETK